nr:MAG TPA: protein of unknown function (DUF4969) [Bacteriophage sp.]
MKKCTYLSLMVALLIALTSCGTRKVMRGAIKEEVAEKVDSVASVKVDSAAVVKNKVVEEKKEVVNLKELINTDEFYFTPINENEEAEFEVYVNDKLYKGKVKNGTISNVNLNKTTDKAVETIEERKIDSLNKVTKQVEEDVKVKKDTELKREEKIKTVDADNRTFPWWIVVLLVILVGGIFIVRTKFKKYL